MLNKSLLLCPPKYSLFSHFYTMLQACSAEVVSYDIRSEISKQENWINTQMFRFPNSVRARWNQHFFQKLNDALLQKFASETPDLVLVYNNGYLLPATCKAIQQRAKLVFFLGDSPFYTPTNDFALACLEYADLILAPDSFWLGQLNTLGLPQTAFFAPGIDEVSYHPIGESTERFEEVPPTEVFYAGMCYKDSWGYKKARLMDQFTSFDFRLYGNNAWQRWFPFFPELENHFELSGFIPTPRLNALYNRTKIVPVDGNPGILNGFHIRLMEALGAGALPLIEYRVDVEERLFRGLDRELPLLRDYRKAADITGYFLKAEHERRELADAMKQHLLRHYAPEHNAARLLELLKKQ